MAQSAGPDTPKLLSQLVRLLTHGLLGEVFAELHAAGETLTEAQYEVLRYIDRHDRPTIGEVAEALGISSAAATKMVRALAENGPTPLVRRMRGLDRRTVRVASTPKGASLVKRVRDGYNARIEAIEAQLSETDREALRRGVTTFLRAALGDPEHCDAACLRCGIDGSEDCLIRLAEVAIPGQRA